MASGDRISGISICHLNAGSAAAFERFCLEVVAPAISSQRPHLTGHWAVLRPNAHSDDADGEASVVRYALVFYGDARDEDWDLASLLNAAYGEAGDRYLDQWDGFFATGQQDLSFEETLTPR